MLDQREGKIVREIKIDKGEGNKVREVKIDKGKLKIVIIDL